MKRRILAAVLLLMVMVTLSTCLNASTGYEPVSLPDLPSNLHIEIKPEIELLAGVLSQTSWIKVRGPYKGEGNGYFRELKNFFAPYKNHKAVKIAEELTKKGFTYDAPVGFVLSLGPLPYLDPVNGYSEYLVERAGGSRDLENFRQELVKLAKESNFMEFYRKHYSELDNLLSASTGEFDGIRVITWLQKFFGAKGDEYCLVLAPGMFPGGGYGVTVETRDGKKIVYEVARENGFSEKLPEFQSGIDLEWLTLHEWGHSFVNPALAKYPDGIRQLTSLFTPVADRMNAMAYGTLETFFNEEVLRAVQLTALPELFHSLDYNMALMNEKSAGFYLTDFTVEQLRYYQKNREKYSTFTDFVPYLLESYQKNTQELLKNAPSQQDYPEIKEIRVSGAYWEGDSKIQGLKSNSPHSFFIEVEFDVDPQAAKEISDFFDKAGTEFQLIAGEKPIIGVQIKNGGKFQIGNKLYWGFWVVMNDTEFAKLEPGVVYKLVPKKQDPEYRWVVGEDVSLVYSNEK